MWGGGGGPRTAVKGKVSKVRSELGKGLPEFRSQTDLFIKGGETCKADFKELQN